MTNEEARTILRSTAWLGYGGQDKVEEAVKMACEALEQPKPCQDTISRQAAIDALRTCYDTEAITYTNGNEYISYDQALDLIDELPSAQPERR